MLVSVSWPCELPDETEIFGTELSLSLRALHRADLKKKVNFTLEQASKVQRGVEA